MEESPPLGSLDYRLPVARSYAEAWFASGKLITERQGMIEWLASNYWGLNSLSSRSLPDPVPGTPGTPEQARARLALLDAIAPQCPEPLLRQKIAAARISLQKYITGEK
jgi:hypothetical protein